MKRGHRHWGGGWGGWEGGQEWRKPPIIFWTKVFFVCEIGQKQIFYL